MASVKRHYTAGEGDSVIVGEGGRSVHKWISYIDSPLDSPLTKLIEANPIHSAHPDSVTFPGTVVTGYSKGEHLSPEAWEVFVHYGPITDEVLNVWFRTGSAGHDARQLEYSLEVRTPNGGFVEAPSRLIAQPSYAIIPERGEGSDAPPVAKTDDLFGPEHKLTYAGWYHAQPEPVALPIGPKTYTINVQQLSAWKIALITKWLGKTNSIPFIYDSSKGSFAYQQWELMFDGFEHTDFVVPFGSGSRGAVATWWTRATLHILFRPIHPVYAPFGWRGIRRFHGLIDPVTGQQRRVLRLTPLPGNANDPLNTDVWDGFTTRDDMNFNTLFATVGGFPPNF